MRRCFLLAAAAMALGLTQGARADGVDDPNRASYDQMKGKSVAYLPQAMGLDLTEGWAAYVKNAADHLGLKFAMRWSELER